MADAEALMYPLDPGNREPSALTPLPGVAGDLASTIWLPTEEIAQKWVAYVTDTSVADDTPPPAPENLEVNGSELHWEAKADLEDSADPGEYRQGESCGETGRAPLSQPRR